MTTLSDGILGDPGSAKEFIIIDQFVARYDGAMCK